MIGASDAVPARLVWGVAALIQAVADALAARFSPCTVRGEISGWSRAASGHCYFNLKDADGNAALLRCAMFRRAAGLLDFMPADGQLVELRGRIGVYEPRGELQLVVETMRPAGAGALYEQFLRLKARLETEGLFDAQRKRVLPAYPTAIGVVTSLAAAALRDVLSTLARRAPHVRIVVYPSLVQGPDAPAALCDAMATAAERKEVDVLILCRGGGSLEDLWAFNDERVVRAVAASPLPVVCGVGHESDVSLADFAADLRAPTPTAAAELTAPQRDTCLQMLEGVAALLQRRLHDRLDTQAQRLDVLASRLSRPAELVRRRAFQLDLLMHRLRAAMQRDTERRRLHAAQHQDRLVRAVRVLLAGRGQAHASLSARLDALDPQRVLARGYAWLGDEAGQALRSVRQVVVDQKVEARMVDGTVKLVVTGVVPRPGD
jgi:exodeoxyribonuclease VII large subunit